MYLCYVNDVYILYKHKVGHRGREGERERVRHTRIHTHRYAHMQNFHIWFSSTACISSRRADLLNWIEHVGLGVTISFAFLALFAFLRVVCHHFKFGLERGAVLARRALSPLSLCACCAKWERPWLVHAAKDIRVSFAAFGILGISRFNLSISLLKSLAMKTTMKAMKSLRKAYVLLTGHAIPWLDRWRLVQLRCVAAWPGRMKLANAG